MAGGATWQPSSPARFATSSVPAGRQNVVDDLVADLRGPAGQIAVMQRHLVDDNRWIGQRRFLHALNYCMLLPGPEAQQLAIYIGWLLNGLRGGLVAGVLFVLPGMVALLVLSASTSGSATPPSCRRCWPGWRRR